MKPLPTDLERMLAALPLLLCSASILLLLYMGFFFFFPSQVQQSPFEPGILSSFKVNIIIMTLCAGHRHSLLLAHLEA